MYGSTGVGIIGVGFNCYGRSNRGSIGHSRMGEGIGMVGIWVSSNSVVEGGWVVSVVSGVQHSGFGLFFFSFTLYHLLLFGITLPVSVSVRVSSPSVVSTPSSDGEDTLTLTDTGSVMPNNNKWQSRACLGQRF